jgi:hypothetical protein
VRRLVHIVGSLASNTARKLPYVLSDSILPEDLRITNELHRTSRRSDELDNPNWHCRESEAQYNWLV